jgi:hypothetical protein
MTVVARCCRLPQSSHFGTGSPLSFVRTHVETWSVLLIGSALIGGLGAWYLRSRRSWLVAIFLPPTLFLAWLLLNEYVLPQGGGGASMWPVAFVIGGTAAALAGCCGFLVTRWVKARRPASP